MTEQNSASPSENASDVLNSEVDKLISILGGEPEEGDAGTAAAETTESGAPQGDEDAAAAADEQASDEEQDDPAKQATPPAIGAPSSWSAEDKAVFATLPPDAQAVIARRESERDKATDTRLKEAAEARNAATAEREAATKERQVLASRFASEEQSLVQQFAAKYPEIRSDTDLDTLAATDPARFAQFQRDREKVQNRIQERVQLEQRNLAQINENRKGYIVEQQKLIAEKVPEFMDSKAGAKIRADAVSYLKEVGFSQPEIDGVLDHKLFIVLRDALKGREYQKAATAVRAKAADAPKVQRPGAAPEKVQPTTAQRRAKTTQILREGSDEDRAGVLMDIIG